MPTNSTGKWKIFFWSPWFLAGALILAVLVAFAYGRAYYKDYQVRQDISRLQKEVENLSAKKLETIELLKYVKSKDFVEEKARTEFNLVKPGEQMAVFSSGSDFMDNGQTDEEVVKWENISNPIKWWRFFWNNNKNN